MQTHVFINPSSKSRNSLGEANILCGQNSRNLQHNKQVSQCS